MSKINVEVNVTKEKKGKTTHIICVLDRSGSMGGLASEVISNFNNFIKEQKEVEGKAKLTLVLFDDKYDVVYDEIDLQDARKLTSARYYARGMTAMNDAVGKILTEKQNKKNAIVLIHTDGHENASREFDTKTIKSLVKKLKKKWEFIFVGANIDAKATSFDYGFTHTLQSNANDFGVANSYAAFNATTTNYRSMGMSGINETAAIVAGANEAELIAEKK